jgi:DNA-binding XRE family transcriptional regulator
MPARNTTKRERSDTRVSREFRPRSRGLRIVPRKDTGTPQIVGTVAGLRVRLAPQTTDPKLARNEAASLQAKILRSNEFAAFNRALYRRVRELRLVAGLTQGAAAEALGIPLRTYQHFEKRSPLPAALIVPFADLVGVDVRELLAGES